MAGRWAERKGAHRAAVGWGVQFMIVFFSIVQSVVLGCAGTIVTIRWRIHIADEIEGSCGT